MEREGDWEDELSRASMLLDKGEASKAIQICDRLVVVTSAKAMAFSLRGIGRFKLEDYSASASDFREAALVEPDYPDVLSNLVEALLRSGEDVFEAMAAVERSLKVRSASFHCEMGLLHRVVGQPGKAEAHFEQALAIDGANVESLLNLTELMVSRRDYASAEPLCARALEFEPSNPIAMAVRAACLLGLDQVREAKALYARAIGLDERRVEWRLGLASSLKRLGKAAEAEAELAKVLLLDPGNAPARTELASYHLSKGLISSARALLDPVVEQAPAYLPAVLTKGRLLVEEGRFADASQCYREAMTMPEVASDAASSLAAIQIYRDDLDSCFIKAVQSEIGKWIQNRSNGLAFEKRRHRPSGKMRIGLLSGDFREHSVAYFIDPLFECLDRDRFELLCYANQNKSDAVTARFQDRADRWNEVRSLDDRQLAELISADEVDTLIDLSGYSSGNRLGAVALRPAARQFTWLGYASALGLPAIDGRIVDEISDPSSSGEGLEPLVRMGPPFLCYAPISCTPDVARLPCLSGERGFTFGSFNNAIKISPACLDFWASVLNAIPDSRLMLKSHQFADANYRERVITAMEARNVSRERLNLRERSRSRAEHLSAYAEVDAALDAYPYNGTTTTCEALWMGVPTLSLTGSRHASRVGATILQAIGMPEWASSDSKELILKAQDVARNPAKLEVLRLGIRDRLASSALMDGVGFCRRFEAVLGSDNRSLAPAS